MIYFLKHDPTIPFIQKIYFKAVNFFNYAN